MAVLKKHQRRTFTVVDNEALRDTRLTWKATGVLAYLLGLPEDWRINMADLANRKQDGRTAVGSALDELEEAGYLKRVKTQDAQGHWTTIIHVAESADLLDEIADQPTLGLPMSEQPTVGLPATTKETDERLSTNKPETVLRNDIWDALVLVFGEPTTNTNRTLRGKVVKSLVAAGATFHDVGDRAGIWPLHFPDMTLTETALEKHWDRLGRPPLKANETDVRRAERKLKAQQLGGGNA